MSGSETNIQWFIARDGKQHGPVSDIEIRKLVELAHLKATDLVWRQGFSDWRSAGSVFPTVDAPAAGASPAAAQPQHTATAHPHAPSGSNTAAPAAVGQAAAPAQPTNGPRPGPGAVPGQPRAPNAPLAAQPYSPFAGGQPGPAPGAPRTGRPGEKRPEPAPTRPLGNPVAPGGSYPGAASGPGPGPGPRADMRRPPDMGVPTPHPHGAPPRPTNRRRTALIAAGLLTMAGAGAWLSAQYKDQILAFVDSSSESVAETESAPEEKPTATASLASDQKPAAPTPVANIVPSSGEVDQKLQARKMWSAVKQQFPERYETIVSTTARLESEHKPQTEITSYLVTELVKLRRENAQHALAASTTRHKELAAAFLANLNTLSRESGDGCYEFISRGETSQAILSRIEDPARSTEIEAQVVVIVQAIAEGRTQPHTHPSPVKTDYDVLAGELGRLGWTQADMQLFANPRELAKAPRDRVCSMLKDWFTAHLAIQDPSTQERLLFETLKPVISG